MRSWAVQWQQLFWRSLMAQIRNPTDATARLLLSCYVGALAGDLWQELVAITSSSCSSSSSDSSSSASCMCCRCLSVLLQSG